MFHLSSERLTVRLLPNLEKKWNTVLEYGHWKLSNLSFISKYIFQLPKKLI